MPETLFDTTTLSPLFVQLLEKRGLLDPETINFFLTPNLSAFRDPLLMKGMGEAKERLTRAAQTKELVMIHGDYDVDGITGSALLAGTLKRLGIKHEVFLPDRKRDGYGVSGEAIESASQRGASLLMTVDCGVAARTEIELARERGLDVIVIDHHRIPEAGLPPANIILNPLQEDCPYPFKELSAAGLAFKLSQAMLGEQAYDFLDLAALSTIGDVAPLKDENRIIVKYGLETLSNRTHLGLKELGKVAGLRASKVNVGHVGFVLGPRLNAAGRMSSPEIALRLLMTQHAKEAASLASALNEENKERQREERQTTKEAIEEVERTINFNHDRVIVVGREGWHAGVIGIVASRLVERYYRPALVIAFEGQTGKASGRSIKGFHLFDALKSSAEHLEQFGGHEQAVGLSILKEKMNAFKTKINEWAKETYGPETFIKAVKVDLEISFDDFSPQFLSELQLLEPHGAGNSRPTFLTSDLKIRGKVEKKYSTYQFFVTDGHLTFPASWTDRSAVSSSLHLKTGNCLDLVYGIKNQSWNGIESVQLDVKEIRPRP